MLGCFLYVSLSCLQKDEREHQIEELVRKARLRNEANKITGTLIFSGYRFAQYLEGPPDALQTIVTSILEDGRHKQVTTLRDSDIEERRFARWALSYAGPSFYVDRHIKCLVGAGPSTPQTEMRIDQLLRLMLGLNEDRRPPPGR